MAKQLDGSQEPGVLAINSEPEFTPGEVGHLHKILFSLILSGRIKQQQTGHSLPADYRHRVRDTILPPACLLAPFTWDIEQRVKAAFWANFALTGAAMVPVDVFDEG